MKIQNHRGVLVGGFAALLLTLAACTPAPGILELPLGRYTGYTNSIQPAFYWYVGAFGEHLQVSAANPDCPNDCPQFKVTIHNGESPTGPVIASGVGVVQAMLPMEGHNRYTIVVELLPPLLILTTPGIPFDLRLTNY
jgi:hypothetical protein